MAPRSALDVLVDLNDKVASGKVAEYQPVPLGFTPLDKTIGGGLRPGELLLIGGAQGTGKTTMALQMARNVASGGQANVLYVCFEHDEQYLLNRLIAMESALAHLPAQDRRDQDPGRPQGDPRHLAGRGRAASPSSPTTRGCGPSLDRIARYGQNLFLLRGSQTAQHGRQHPQARPAAPRAVAATGASWCSSTTCRRCPRSRSRRRESEKVTYVVNGLKDIALSEDVPMIAIVAADKEGLKAARLRNHHLRGSSAINYEADIILILNEKYHIVAKVNIEFNPYQAQRFRDWVVVLGREEPRRPDNVDLEFEKHFEFSASTPTAGPVQEKLIEERLYND